jgi:hypothetical protein
MRFPLLPAPKGAALHEPGPAPLWEADLDDIEVPWDDGLGEHGPRLARDLGPEVPVREVREREHLHSCGPRELGDVDRRGVERLVRA